MDTKTKTDLIDRLKKYALKAVTVEEKWAGILTLAFKKILKKDKLQAVSDGKQLLLGF